MGALITRVKLRNYKSIASCDVRLNELSVLVGLNGAGKSNFLDAFAFISDACNNTLDAALRNRGGIGAVRRKSGGHPNNFGMSFFANLDGVRNAFFAFEISALPGEKFEVKKEVASISDPDPSKTFQYRIERGKIHSMTDIGVTPDIRPDRLFLTSVAGLKPFDLLFDAMSSLVVYDINPDEFRFPQPHEAGDLLSTSGQNLAAVLRELSEEAPTVFRRVCEFLKRIVVGIERVEVKSLGPTETIKFSQKVQGIAAPWRFDALNMSSGTLRSLGVLTALFHQQMHHEPRSPFVGIEEPEGTIHPGAAAVLMDAILEASGSGQVILTTHSPELLDHEGVRDDNLLVVTSERNETAIGHADTASRAAMKENLMTAGELLRANQLSVSKSNKVTLTQAKLFEQ
ncbi:AAA family ATPase [Alterinioella nitratireducens]|uniref:AAA family ATPase n=1 Tax=Alterinioella nitratireducens TaxID=2735915 RepID=UPI004058AC02